MSMGQRTGGEWDYMKILIVNKFLHPNGGSETYIFGIGRQLAQMGHQVQYFGMDHPERAVGNEIDSYTANMDFHTGRLKKFIYPFKILYSFEAKRKMLALLHYFEPEIIHLNNFNFQLTPALFYAVKKYSRQSGRRLPIIYTAHDYQWVCPNHMMKIPADGRVCFACRGGRFLNCTRNKCIHNRTIQSFLGSLEGYLYKWRRTYCMTDVIICPSDFMKRTLSANPDLADKTVTLHNFITADSTEPATQTAELSADQKAELSADQKAELLTDQTAELPPEIREKDYLLYFGRLSAEKGVGTLLEACRRLPEILFVFAGKGELAPEVQTVKNVFYAGFRSGNEMTALIKQAKFVLFPSEWYENCPFSVMEAQRYGTPVLAAAIGGTTELIKPEVTGEFFPPGDTDELTAKIKNLWNDPVKVDKYKDNCRGLNFDTLAQYCEKLIDIYKNASK